MGKELSLTYRDAVQLLAADEEALRRLDQLLGLGLLAAAPFAPAIVLPLFEVKSELVRRLADLTSGLRSRVRGSWDLDRQKLIIAAHAVIVVASFIEDLSTRLTTLDADGKWRKEIERWEAPQRQTSVATQERGGGRTTHLLDWGRHTLIEPPTPTRPLECVTEEIRRLYRSLSSEALSYIKGFVRWDQLNESEQQRAEDSIINSLPNSAIQRYLANYVKLAGEVPEFLAWVFVNDQRATRELIKQLSKNSDAQLKDIELRLAQLAQHVRDESAALASIPRMLDYLRGGALQSSYVSESSATAPLELHDRLQRIVLDKPLLKPELVDGLPDLNFPTAVNGYINPHFRMVQIEAPGGGLLLAQEDWWLASSVDRMAIRPIRAGLAAHLVLYLSTPRATSVPLIVLGHPGSGKSLFSRVITAQLPLERYLVVRVELRHVDPSASVAEQVDSSLRRESNGAYGWRELTDGADRLTRVIVLDGLDELLQLSGQEGLGRYLERVQDFQEREDALGHPTAAIVTARTLVMDRLYVPSGTVALKLEEFDDDQIKTWVSVWNQVNRSYFTEAGLRPCDAAVVARHRHLAGQPLLLMMLALYDADDNGLHTTDQLTQSDLYESLFRKFAMREVLKRPTAATRPDLLEKQVEERLGELSAIALGLFNRGRKFISRDEVERDLSQLGLQRRHDSSGPNAVTSEMALSQFFFLYKAEALDSHENIRHGYEFLHATFGEFLVARALIRGLTQVGGLSHSTSAWDADALPKMVTSYLGPYLAHRPMVAEKQLLGFVSDMRQASSANARPAVAVLMESLRVLLSEFRWTGDYHPTVLSTVKATAIWGLNLLLVILIIQAHPINLTRDLLGPDPLLGWRRLVGLWKAELEPDDWDAVIQLFVVTLMPDGTNTIVLGFEPDREDLSIVSSDYVTRADAIRGLLEARLLIDRNREASAGSWIGILERALLKDPENDADLLVISQVINFAASSNVASAVSGDEFLPRLIDALRRRWMRPILEIGATGWSDSGLMDLAARLQSNSGDVLLEDTKLLCSVLRELLRRDHADVAAQVLRNLPEIPVISDAYDAAFLLQAIYEFRIDLLRIPLARATVNLRNVVRMLANPDAMTWFVTGQSWWDNQYGNFKLEESLSSYIEGLDHISDTSI